MSTDVASNLRRLRGAQRRSQKDLAAAAGISVAALRNIEQARSEPRADTARALAAALDVPLRLLYEHARKLQHVRFRSRKKLRTREQILVDVARWLDDYSRLEIAVDDRMPPWRLKHLASTDLRGAELATEVRKILQLGQDPIFDIAGLLEEKARVKVLGIPVDTDSFFGLSVNEPDTGPAVIVNTCSDRIPVERWIFSAAHELGHLILHCDTAFDIDNAEESKAEEREADAFAGHFLMPAGRFDSEWDEASGKALLERVLKVKRIFRVSYKSVLHRVAERDGFPFADLIKRFQWEHKRRYGRTLAYREEPDSVIDESWGLRTEPDRLAQSDFSSDRLESLVRRAWQDEQISLGRVAEILQIPLADARERARDWVHYN